MEVENRIKRGNNSHSFFDNQIAVRNPGYVNSQELARILDVSVHTIRKWRSQGRIVPRKFGRSVRYVVDEVVRTITQKGQANAK
ncbi:MAG: DNA-binding protein [Proteobacteria bacterium]|nr:MAG: DNA-binding protein [Pseudomonadota bacterium]